MLYIRKKEILLNLTISVAITLTVKFFQRSIREILIGLPPPLKKRHRDSFSEYFEIAKTALNSNTNKFESLGQSTLVSRA